MVSKKKDKIQKWQVNELNKSVRDEYKDGKNEIKNREINIVSAAMVEVNEKMV